MDLAKLKELFPPADVEWRVQNAGKTNTGKIWALVLAYITNRAIMDRLDNVCGPENWRNEYISGPDGGVLCGLSIRVGDEWITKYDGAHNTDVEPVKGGLSGAMKRAGVQWGIGRYLYHLPEQFAKITANGEHRGKLKDGTRYRWETPSLPDWAIPKGSKRPNQKTPQQAQSKQKPPEDEQPPEAGPLLSQHEQAEIKKKLKEVDVPPKAFGIWLKRVVNVPKLHAVPQRWYQHINDVLDSRPNEMTLMGAGDGS